MDVPTISSEEVGWIDSTAMHEVDRIMIEELGISLVQMMENAGRSLADLIIWRFNPQSVNVFAGPGGNGGGGLAAARHLHNRGVRVSVMLTRPGNLTETTSHQADILKQMGVPLLKTPDLSADVIVDAMVGYSLSGPLRGTAADVAERLQDQDSPVVSLDMPSGLNTTNGRSLGICVEADATMTLSLPKLGLRDSSYVGELYLGDISVPPSVVSMVSKGPAPPFSRGRILRIVE